MVIVMVIVTDNQVAQMNFLRTTSSLRDNDAIVSLLGCNRRSHYIIVTL